LQPNTDLAADFLLALRHSQPIPEMFQNSYYLSYIIDNNKKLKNPKKMPLRGPGGGVPNLFLGWNPNIFVK
jgi:hypothetical protein